MGMKDAGKTGPISAAGCENEVVPLNVKHEVVLMLEELEGRLEMQRMPMGSLSECSTQAEGCYSDDCDSFCEHCAYNVGCQDHCYCNGTWCVENCYPVDCGLYCSECTDHGSGMY